MLGLPKGPNTKLRIDAIFCTYIQALLYSENNVLNPPPPQKKDAIQISLLGYSRFLR